jgi:hypothetical protein
MYEHIFKHIKVDIELTSKEGFTRICAEIPYDVFDVMPLDKVIEFFLTEPEFDDVEDYEEKKVVRVTYQSNNDYFLIYRRKRLLEFDNKINELKKENFL